MFDTETTGLDFQKDRILEYGCLRVRDNQVVDTLRLLARTGKTIPAEASAIHGITQADIDREGIDAKDACLQVMKFLGGDLVLGVNNLFFDLQMLEVECNRHGVSRPKAINWYDVGMLHKGMMIGQVWNQVEPFFNYAQRIKDLRIRGVRYSVDFMVKHYEVENLRENGRHDAVTDIKLTKHIFEKIKAKYASIES